MENKTIIIVDSYGKVMTDTSLTQDETHDKIIYRMFKDFLDKLTEEEKNVVAKLLPTDDFENSYLKNIFLVTYYLNMMIIAENIEWMAVFLPRDITRIQEEYYLKNYDTGNYLYQSCYFFDKDNNYQVSEINDLLHPIETIERIKEQISKNCQEIEGQKTRGI